MALETERGVGSRSEGSCEAVADVFRGFTELGGGDDREGLPGDDEDLQH
jgi:hypothetical protein